MHSCDDVISTCHGTLAPHMELVQVQRACNWYDHGTVIGDLESSPPVLTHLMTGWLQSQR
jgi:hypothetical protein